MNSSGHKILVKFLELAPIANPASIKNAKHKYVTKPLLRPKVPHISLTSDSWLTNKEIKPAKTYKPINLKFVINKSQNKVYRYKDNLPMDTLPIKKITFKDSIYTITVVEKRDENWSHF